MRLVKKTMLTIQPKIIKYIFNVVIKILIFNENGIYIIEELSLLLIIADNLTFIRNELSQSYNINDFSFAFQKTAESINHYMSYIFLLFYSFLACLFVILPKNFI